MIDLKSLSREEKIRLYEHTFRLVQSDRLENRRYGPVWKRWEDDPVRFILEGLGQFREESWRGWRTVLKAIYGQPLDSEFELPFFRHIAERDPPKKPVSEFWAVVGRRGGKTALVSAVNVEKARTADRAPLRFGERARIACLAVDRDQAGVVFGYILGYFEEIPGLKDWVLGDLPRTYRSGPIALTNRTEIAVMTNNFRAPRGRAIAAATFDECLVAGTLIRTEHGELPIEFIRAGDRVYTRQGLRVVEESRMTNPDAVLYQVEFSNGSKLIGTAGHPLFVVDVGFVPLVELRRNSEVLTWNSLTSVENKPVEAVKVKSINRLDETGSVYNLQVQDCPEYYANGILTHNCAFWRSEDSATPDVETYRAIQPSMGTIPNSLLVGISSPYRRKGLLYDKYKSHFGKDSDDTLVIKATTRELNPTFSQSIIDRAIADDPDAAAAEYLAEFRSDLADYVPREVVETLIDYGTPVRPPEPFVQYHAFVDPSGGSRDSMTLGIAHREGENGVLDLLDEVRAPFEPSVAVERFASLMKTYKISSCTGDRYGGVWPTEKFAQCGILYEASELVKSDIYREFLSHIMSRKVVLLDDRRAINQLCSLERRTARGGRDSIDHPPAGHDDVANVMAGALLLVVGQPDKLAIWRQLSS